MERLAPKERRLLPPESLKLEVELKNQNRKGNKNIVSSFPPLSPPPRQAFREGGVAGVVEGLAQKERRLPPPESLGDGVTN